MGPAEASAPRGSAPVYPVRCESTGEWSFSASGTGLERFEGARVWASAVERDKAPPEVVVLEGRIKGGKFSLACPKSLTDNNAYPTSAVIIDADGSGTCSAEDRQAHQQMYAWNFDVTVAVEPKVLSLVREAHTVVGDRKTFDFCATYLPKLREAR